MLDEETERLTWVLLFVNEEAAQKSIEELKVSIEEDQIDEGVKIINFHRDGRFTVMTYEEKVF